MDADKSMESPVPDAPPEPTKTRVDESLRDDFLLVRGEQLEIPDDPKNHCSNCGVIHDDPRDYGRWCGSCIQGDGTLFPIHVFISTYRRVERETNDPARSDGLLTGRDVPPEPLKFTGYGESSPENREKIDDCELRYPGWATLRPEIERLMRTDRVTATTWDKFKDRYMAISGHSLNAFLRQSISTVAFILKGLTHDDFMGDGQQPKGIATAHVEPPTMIDVHVVPTEIKQISYQEKT